MNYDLATKNDLEEMKVTLLKAILSNNGAKPEVKKWVKSSEVRDILGCSPGTLQNLRVNGTLEYTKIGGTIYYSSASVDEVFEKNKRSVA